MKFPSITFCALQMGKQLETRKIPAPPLPEIRLVRLSSGPASGPPILAPHGFVQWIPSLALGIAAVPAALVPILEPTIELGKPPTSDCSSRTPSPSLPEITTRCFGVPPPIVTPARYWTTTPSFAFPRSRFPFALVPM